MGKLNLSSLGQAPKPESSLSQAEKEEDYRKNSDIIDQNSVYYSARQVRNLYDDDELHSMFVTMMLPLLIKPTSGVLEDIYCS